MELYCSTSEANLLGLLGAINGVGYFNFALCLRLIIIGVVTYEEVFSSLITLTGFVVCIYGDDVVDLHLIGLLALAFTKCEFVEAILIFALFATDGCLHQLCGEAFT